MTADQDAVLTLWAAISPPSGEIPLRIHRKDRTDTKWFPVGEKTLFCESVRALAQRYEIRVGLPRPSRHRPVAETCVFWARGESGEADNRIAHFRQRPTLLLRDGATCKVTAFWALRRTLKPDFALLGNERLATHLRGRRSDADPDYFWFRPPTAVLLEDRELPVITDVYPDGFYAPHEVVGANRKGGKLDDPPKLKYPIRR